MALIGLRQLPERPFFVTFKSQPGHRVFFAVNGFNGPGVGYLPNQRTEIEAIELIKQYAEKGIKAASWDGDLNRVFEL